MHSNQDMQNYRLKNHSFVAMDVKTVYYEIGSKILSRIEIKICNAKYNFCVNFFEFIYCGQQKDPYSPKIFGGNTFFPKFYRRLPES